MDKNNIIGFVLIAVVLIGFSWWTKPSAEQQAAAFKQDSIAQAVKQQQKAAVEERAKTEQQLPKDTSSLFYTSLQGKCRSEK